MSINYLESEATEINEMIQEVLERKKALASVLEPMIHKYFSALVLIEKNPEKRRDYAYFNVSKNFEILDGKTLRFKAKNRSDLITYDVLIADLLEG